MLTWNEKSAKFCPFFEISKFETSKLILVNSKLHHFWFGWSSGKVLGCTRLVFLWDNFLKVIIAAEMAWLLNTFDRDNFTLNYSQGSVKRVVRGQVRVTQKSVSSKINNFNNFWCHPKNVKFVSSGKSIKR